MSTGSIIVLFGIPLVLNLLAWTAVYYVKRQGRRQRRPREKNETRRTNLLDGTGGRL